MKREKLTCLNADTLSSHPHRATNPHTHCEYGHATGTRQSSTPCSPLQGSCWSHTTRRVQTGEPILSPSHGHDRHSLLPIQQGRLFCCCHHRSMAMPRRLPNTLLQKTKLVIQMLKFSHIISVLSGNSLNTGNIIYVDYEFKCILQIFLG